MKGGVFTDPEEHRFEPAVVELLSVAPAVEAHRPRRRESSGRSLSTTLPTQLPFFTDGHSVSTFVLSTRQSADYALSTSPPPGLPWPRSHRDPSLFTHGSPLLWPGWCSCLIRESFITHPLSSGDDDSVTASWLLQCPSPSFLPLVSLTGFFPPVPAKMVFQLCPRSFLRGQIPSKATDQIQASPFCTLELIVCFRQGFLGRPPGASHSICSKQSCFIRAQDSNYKHSNARTSSASSSAP